MQFDPGKGSGCKASYAQKYDPDPRGIDKKQVSVASTILISVHRNCCCSINRCLTKPACVLAMCAFNYQWNHIDRGRKRKRERNMRISRCVLPFFEDPCISFSFFFVIKIELASWKVGIACSSRPLFSRREERRRAEIICAIPCSLFFGYLLRDIVLVSRHACLLLAQWYPVRFGGFTVYVNVFFNRIARFSRKDYLLIFTPPRKLVIRLCLKRDFESLKRNR